MKRKSNTRLLPPFFILSCSVLLTNAPRGICSDFKWTMYLPAITGKMRTCSSDPQTAMWKGREWQRCDDGHEYNLEGARLYCGGLTVGGYRGWRLPTKVELKSLVVCTNGHPVPLQDHLWCSSDGYSENFRRPTIASIFEAQSSGYWTTTVYEGQNAWMVNFYGGNSDLHNGVWNGNLVRCVR